MPNQKIILKYERKDITVDGRKENEKLKDLDVAKQALDAYNEGLVDIDELSDRYGDELDLFLRVMDMYLGGRWIPPEYWQDVLLRINEMLEWILNNQDDSFYTDEKGNVLGGNARRGLVVPPIRYAWIELGQGKMIVKPAKAAKDPSKWVVINTSRIDPDFYRYPVNPSNYEGAYPSGIHRTRILPVDQNTFIIICSQQMFANGEQGLQVAGRAILCSADNAKIISRPALSPCLMPNDFGEKRLAYFYIDVNSTVESIGYIELSQIKTTQIPSETYVGIEQILPFKSTAFNYLFPSHESGSGLSQIKFSNYDQGIDGIVNGTYNNFYVKTAWHPLPSYAQNSNVGIIGDFNVAGQLGNSNYPNLSLVSGLYGNNVRFWDAQEDVYLGNSAYIHNEGDYEFCMGTPAGIAAASGIKTPEGIKSWCDQKAPGAKTVFTSSSQNSQYPNYLTRNLDSNFGHTVVNGTAFTASKVTYQSAGIASQPLWFEAITTPKDTYVSFTLTTDKPTYREIITSTFLGFNIGSSFFYTPSTLINNNADSSSQSTGSGYGRKTSGDFYDHGWYWPSGSVKTPGPGDTTFNIKLKPENIPDITLSPSIRGYDNSSTSLFTYKTSTWWNSILNEPARFGTSSFIYNMFDIVRSYNQFAVFSYAAGRSWKEELIALGFAPQDLTFADSSS